MRLRAVVDHQAIAELLRDPHRGRDVIGPVAVLSPRNLTLQDLAKSFEFEISGSRLGTFGGKVFKVVACLDQRGPDHSGRAEPGRGRLLALAVDALGVLAERGLEAGRA